MLQAFLIQAAVSPSRQRTFRWAVISHLALLVACVWWACYRPALAGAMVGYVLLTAGIVEGAILIGWRLSQLPKSQALEFLLVSPLRPAGVFLGEATVGLARLAMISFSSLVVLVFFVLAGYLDWIDVGPLIFMPWTWGAITGLGLTAWAYEPVIVRRWGERFMMLMIGIYLVVGVLAGEHLKEWIAWLPPVLARLVLDSVLGFHHYNPFAVLHFWFTDDLAATWDTMLWVESLALGAVLLLLGRCAWRLRGHFHDHHYRPFSEARGGNRGTPGDHPLSWWAVRRVTEYAGRANLWAAGGFGILYAVYTLAGPAWPSWLGSSVFKIFDDSGGVPVWATALVVLSAVPAAFQYGLWDSNTHDRCLRLELLLLTGLTARDYWNAAAAAAWIRGRGYFFVACVLFLSAVIARIVTPLQGVAAVAGGGLLWALYFAVGFRAFTRGMEANRMGLALTIGLPIAVFVLTKIGWSFFAACLPPGAVYYAAQSGESVAWLFGMVLSGALALVIGRRAIHSCDHQLRLWYEQHHGRAILD
jgi:hypothetical protein